MCLNFFFFKYKDRKKEWEGTIIGDASKSTWREGTCLDILFGGAAAGVHGDSGYKPGLACGHYTQKKKKNTHIHVILTPLWCQVEAIIYGQKLFFKQEHKRLLGIL